MKLKYYLRGCGIGILVTAVIFMMAVKIKDPLMTDQEVMERASELGMVMSQDTGNGLQTQNTPTTQNVSKVQNTTEPPTESVIPTESAAQEPPQDTQQPAEEKKTSRKEKKSVWVSVNRGEVCRDVANRLYEKGLVKDAEEFRVYMGEHGYDKKLYAGSFKLKKGMSYEEIAKTMTER